MPLQDDLIRQLQSRTEVPAPDQPGSVLTAQQDLTVDWGNPPDEQILDGTVDPNGVVYAYAGRLYVRRGSTPQLWQNQDGLTTWSLVGGSSAGSSALGVYGDGSDGVVNFDGSATVLGFAPSSGIYTISRDLYLDDGSQVSGSAVLKMHGYRLFCRGTLTVGASAIMSNDGGDASGTTAGVAGDSGYFQNGQVGGNGGSGGNGVQKSTLANAIGGAGAASGASSGGPGVGGGRGTGPVTGPGAGGLPRNILQALLGGITTTLVSSNVVSFQGGNGGSGGDAAASSTGGGGGGGGGIFGLYAQHVTNSGIIRAKGGTGANGGGSGSGGGGGGGGGGGAVIRIYNSWSGNIPLASGGTGGTPQGAGKSGDTGSAGTVFSIANA